MSAFWVVGLCFLGLVRGIGTLLPDVITDLLQPNDTVACYPNLGCFPNDAPWSGVNERPMMPPPQTPQKINTRFLLFTLKNPDRYQEINASDVSSISSSNFNTSKKTCIIIHSYLENGEAAWPKDMCWRMFKVKDVNCIVVDWRGGSYETTIQSVSNIRIVGAEVSNIVQTLEATCDYSPSNVHIIGHGLGAHAAGEAGKRTPGVARITGLNPSAPDFQCTPLEVRLDPSDATFVDIIHTNAGNYTYGVCNETRILLIPEVFLNYAHVRFGIGQNCGHLDFYPDGGQYAPGCPLVSGIPNETFFNEMTNIIFCHSRRAITLFLESISNSSAFTSYPCSDYSTFQKGSCTSCPSDGCPKMGFYADEYPGVTSHSQVFYLSTSVPDT
ncbi:pancreatic lipase-related protein 2-like [Discoglossus pictus]